MKDAKTLLKNYYYSVLEHKHRSKHNEAYYSFLFPEGEPTEEVKRLIAIESDITSRLKEDIETTLKIIESMKTEKYKQLLILRYLKNLDWREIEKATGYNKQYLRGAMHAAALNEATKTIQTL